MVKLLFDDIFNIRNFIDKLFSKIIINYGSVTEITAEITSNVNDPILNIFQKSFATNNMVIFYNPNFIIFYSIYDFKQHFEYLHDYNVYIWINGKINHQIISKILDIDVSTSCLLFDAHKHNYTSIFRINNIDPIVWKKIELNYQASLEKNKFVLDLIKTWNKENDLAFPFNLMNMFLDIIAFSGKTDFQEFFDDLMECTVIVAKKCPLMYKDTMVGSTVMAQLMLRFTTGRKHVFEDLGEISLGNFEKFYGHYCELIKN